MLSIMSFENILHCFDVTAKWKSEEMALRLVALRISCAKYFYKINERIFKMHQLNENHRFHCFHWKSHIKKKKKLRNIRINKSVIVQSSKWEKSTKRCVFLFQSNRSSLIQSSNHWTYQNNSQTNEIKNVNRNKKKTLDKLIDG